ncbi:alpha-glucuronidase [Bacteroidaceae bacterium HV4-6-C5C]|jgi:Alpha-glucuronidase|nr:alpha-glucuronidase [Bacteroidaceae bacterium HV4-6-C5C]
MKKIVVLLFLIVCCVNLIYSENGYDLWLRYKKVDNPFLYSSYREKNHHVIFPCSSDKLLAAKNELRNGFLGLLDLQLTETEVIENNTLVVGTPKTIPAFQHQPFIQDINKLNDDGFVIRSLNFQGKQVTGIIAKTDIGILYGVFRYLRLMQMHSSIERLAITEEPSLKYRVLNHWDNLNGTIERGYAGSSLWDWERLPTYKDKRYTDYARANASIGINGSILNNVNASAKSLRADWLVKAAGLADVFRPYGIKVYLTAKFSAPKEIGGLDTADPLDPKVKQWWKDKVKEIYALIPDFGGFLVKANSEGQPGPQDYGRTHADGANMLADALEPFGGIVFWRAFVYQNERHVDRVVTGYNEFKPLDGTFRRNVFVQPKNGPIDFQPREPFHPLFGAMPNTPLAMEFQITQENLGHAGHLVYLGTLYEETLQSDTYENGTGSTVSRILQNYNKTYGMSAIAGVSNIGSDLNWTGHLFGQANWYAFGRLAWNPDLSSKDIAKEWVRLTFSNKEEIIDPILNMMLMSREAAVNYMMPLGINHIMNFDTHNGPEPWHDDPVWTAFDYHKVTKDSIGVDRTINGSNAVSQYRSPVKEEFNDIQKCPSIYLLWFHRVPWNYKMPSGQTLWNELVAHYYKGVDEVEQMQNIWNRLKGKIDNERFEHVSSLLKLQKGEAAWWRDACVLFFQQYSGLPIPEGYSHPEHSLEYYKQIPFPYNWDQTNFFEK